MTPNETPLAGSELIGDDRIHQISCEISHDVRWDSLEGPHKIRWTNKTMGMAIRTINELKQRLAATADQFDRTLACLAAMLEDHANPATRAESWMRCCRGGIDLPETLLKATADRGVPADVVKAAENSGGCDCYSCLKTDNRKLARFVLSLARPGPEDAT